MPADWSSERGRKIMKTGADQTKKRMSEGEADSDEPGTKLW